MRDFSCMKNIEAKIIIPIFLFIINSNVYSNGVPPSLAVPIMIDGIPTDMVKAKMIKQMLFSGLVSMLITNGGNWKVL